MKQPTIVCDSVSKKFAEQGDIYSVQNVSFSAYEDELIMLMGPSGSGKTTLISIVGGILTPTSGTCQLLGKDLSALSDDERTTFRGKHVGFMFQQFNLVPTLTALENVAIPLLLNGYSEAEAYSQAAAFLDSLGLEQQKDKKARNLSGGEQQRVSIARGCILKPKILLCDEPTSSLDGARGRQVMQLLKEIKQQNRSTLIVVTHDHRILEFADRILVIEDGKLVEKNGEQIKNK